MTLEEIEQVLAVALKLRSPEFGATAEFGASVVGGREKVARLENYLLKSANVNGDLVEARHWLRLLETKLRDDWDALAGWEVALKRPRAKATKDDIQQAKIAVAPAQFEAGRKLVGLRASIDDQIARLEREERVVSRAYTIITGS